jgi:hypothetical protein
MQKNNYKKFLDFLLEQIALFPDFDFSVGDTPELSSRSFYRNLQTYTAHYALMGLNDDNELYQQFRKDLQADVLLWQQICKAYSEIVKSNSKDKYQKLVTIIKAYREKLTQPEQPEQKDELPETLKEEVGLSENEDAEAEALLQEQQQKEEKKAKKKA